MKKKGYAKNILSIVLMVMFVFGTGLAVAFAAPDVNLTPEGKVPGGPFDYLQQQIDNIQSGGTVAYAIGDTGPAGGIVFYITADGLHGLEAAPDDQSTDAPWGCAGTDIAGAEGKAVGLSEHNTYDILADCGDTGTAAEIAHEYMLNGYFDWFLPSKDELNLLYQQKDVMGGFAKGLYWSSTENGSYLAWSQYFNSGYQDFTNKGYKFRVRAVRAF
jgi:hypothetical protein